MSNVDDAKSRGSKGSDSRVVVMANEAATSATDQRLHVLGVECRASLESAKVHFLEVAVRIAEAKRLLTKLGGRGSKFPQWLAEHLPEIEPKTADRWASVANSFGLNADNLSDFRKVFERIRLTALYRLSSPSVPTEARDEAIAAAKKGESVGEARANEIVRQFCITSYGDVGSAANGSSSAKCAGDRSAKPKIHRKKVQLKTGMITLAINHQNFREALDEAIRQLSEQGGSVDSSGENTNGP